MSDVRSGARRLGVAASALLFGLFLMLRVAPAAQAATDCTYDSVNRQVNFVMQGGDGVIGVSGSNIVADDDDSLAGATQCGIATVNNTDGVNVDAATSIGFFVIDLSGGQLAPGETPEASGTSEIEINATDSLFFTSIRVIGTDGNDNIVWGAGGNTIVDGTGAINLNGDNDADVTFDEFIDYEQFGGDGDDNLSFAGGSGTGVTADDAGSNFMGGDDGNDTLTGMDDDNDTMDGGEGNDVLSGLGSSDTVNDTGVVQFGDGFTCATDENDILNGGEGDDSLDGGDGSDLIAGDNGFDDESGGDCNDVCDEGNGPNGGDSFHGNSNEPVDLHCGPSQGDVVDYHQRNSDLFVDIFFGGFNDGEIGAAEGDRVGGGIEAVLGGTGNDEIIGTGFDQFLAGDGGNDTLDGAGGNDCIQGGAGDDDLNGGGGTTHDTVDYSDSAAGVTVDLTAGTATGNGTDTLDGFRDVNGSAFNDTITGEANENHLFGNDGNDSIDGQDGPDFSDGGAGSDNVVDTGTGANENSFSDDHLLGGLGNDTVNGGDGGDDLDGDNDENDLTGQGNDTIEGGEGDDQIDGEGGDDTLTDSGADTDFNDDNFQGGDGSDTMTDTTTGDDDFNGDSGFNDETG